MSKQTMGRGLGALMTEGKPQGDNQNSNGKTEIAAGVRTLMQGATPKPAPVVAAASAPKVVEFKREEGRSSPSSVPSKKGPAIPAWYFLVADALLISLALLIAFTSPKPMPTSRMIFSIVIVVAAAGCGLC